MYKVLQGDARKKLLEIPEKSIQCVVTSPPYWGLRDYGLEPSMWGGDLNCEHEWVKAPPRRNRKSTELVGENSKQATNKGATHDLTETDICYKCGAWLGCLGLEPTPEIYINNLVEIFRGVRRVLRDDGVVWLNLGSSYAGSGKAGRNPEYQKRHVQFGQIERRERMGVPIPARSIGYKPKDLIPIPWMVAMALQQDGWYLRSGMPWVKRSAMPEPVRDRPARALEYFFLLSKSRKYFYDVEAVRMPGAIPAGTKAAKGSKERAGQDKVNARPPEYKTYSGTRHRRNTDWFFESLQAILDGENGAMLHDENDLPIAVFCNPQPYPKAHFATYSPLLIAPMILAGASPRACEICGAPWERVVEKKKVLTQKTNTPNKEWEISGGRPYGQRARLGTKTTGWQPTCKCENEGTGKCTVLDPFVGSGTTLGVAEVLGRNSIGIEPNPEYCKLIPERVTSIAQ